LLKGDCLFFVFSAQFLHSRTYQGLEVGVIGDEEPSVLEQGRSGTAREYQGG